MKAVWAILAILVLGAALFFFACYLVIRAVTIFILRWVAEHAAQ